MIKYGCICGWIGQKQDMDAERACPRCRRTNGLLRTCFPIIRCPRCGTNKHVQVTGYNLYHCHQCHGAFDDDPDEGGDYGNNPSRRLEREEERKERRMTIACKKMNHGN